MMTVLVISVLLYNLLIPLTSPHIPCQPKFTFIPMSRFPFATLSPSLHNMIALEFAVKVVCQRDHLVGGVLGEVGL
jgi:hypothetical protein